jgi:hypothetical protein
MPDVRQPAQAPASPDLYGLKAWRDHLKLAYLLQHRQVMQLDVGQLCK